MLVSLQSDSAGRLGTGADKRREIVFIIRENVLLSTNIQRKICKCQKVIKGKL